MDRNRRWLDQAVLRCTVKAIKDKDPKALKGVDSNNPPTSTVFDAAEINELRKVKVVVILSDARAVFLRLPECLVVDCFVYTPKPPDSTDETKRGKTFPPRAKTNKVEQMLGDSPALFSYRIVRWIAWVAFGGE